MQGYKKNPKNTIYEKNKNIKKQSYKAYYLVKEILKNYNIDIESDIYLDEEEENVCITYRELEKLIKYYIKEENKNKSEKLYKLYKTKCNDEIFIKKLYSIIYIEEQRGIPHKLVSYILNDGTINNK